jgi:hypothetical protein
MLEHAERGVSPVYVVKQKKSAELVSAIQSCRVMSGAAECRLAPFSAVYDSAR